MKRRKRYSRADKPKSWNKITQDVIRRWGNGQDTGSLARWLRRIAIAKLGGMRDWRF